MGFFDSIFGWIKNIFSSLEHEWHKLEQPIKNAITWGSSLVNTVVTNIDATPQFLLDIIQKQLPGLDIAKLKSVIDEVGKDIVGFNSVPADDIYGTLTNLQNYFKGLGDKKWESEASTIAQKFASLFAPEGVSFATIVTFIEFVYRTIVKKQP
jgi:hypothetical protein